MDIDGRVVIARDLPTIPPTGLDAFWLAEQTQRATTPRQSAALGQKLRSRQQPQGPAENRPRDMAAFVAGHSLPCSSRLRACPGIFRPMSRQHPQAMHRFGSEARAQAFNELGSFGTGAPAVLAGLPEMLGRKRAWRQGARAKLAGTHRLRQGETAQKLTEELGQPANIRHMWRESTAASSARRRPGTQQ